MRVPTIRRVYGVMDGDHIRVHAPQRMMPIILVPGFMGSRLSDPKTGKLVWNPTGIPFGPGPRAFKVDTERLQQPAPLIADEKNGYKDRERKRRVKHIKHYNNLMGNMYSDLAMRLSRLHGGDFENFGVKPKLYCAGYDWRQDNAHSALRLAKIVEEALFECRAEKCIIVAHDMGGLVARYYCKLLGGEKRVQALFLIGSPTLGLPDAYKKLKAGIGGPNLKEPVGAAMWAIGMGIALIADPSEMENMFRHIYLLLSLGAGKFLSKDDTRYLMRQFASLYQLMPNSVFCHDNKHWVIFDPLQTGHPPTGTMLLFPNVLDGAVEGAAAAMACIDEEAAKWGQELKDATTSGRALRTSERAHRNVETLEEIAKDIEESWNKIEDDGFEIHKIYKKVRELYDRADECIYDCRPHDHLYRDIYTGLLDVVKERPLTAGHLELALRFDEALRDGEGGHSGGGIGLMKALLRPFMLALGAGDADDHGSGGRENEHESHEEEGPKVYMHPCTINIYSNTSQVGAGVMLIPIETLSNDDSNEVHYTMLSAPFGLDGDGSVPAMSANPPESRLSHPFEATRNCEGVKYSKLQSDSGVIDYIAERIDGMVRSFCRD